MAGIDGSGPNIGKGSTIAIAIILPTVFIIVICVLITIALVIPRMSNKGDLEAREDLKKRRLRKLDHDVEAQHFGDWAAKQESEHPEKCINIDPICVICLDEIDEKSQVRGLACLHVFHQECVDDWFARCNEYCPLCHRPIVKEKKGKKERTADPTPAAFMV